MTWRVGALDILREIISSLLFIDRPMNFIFILTWFYHTGPLIADDLARGGIWMFEPIPLRLLRGGLGLGVKGDGWWCWKGPWLAWYTDDTRWQSGIRLV